MINILWGMQMVLTVAEIVGAYWFISKISREKIFGCKKWIQLVGMGNVAGLSIYQRSHIMYSRLWLVHCILSCGILTILCHKEERAIICTAYAVYFETLYCLDLFLYIGVVVCFLQGDFRTNQFQIGIGRIAVFLIARGIMAALMILFYRKREKAIYYFKTGGAIWIIVLLAEHFSLILCDNVFILGLEKKAINGWKIILLLCPFLLLLLAFYLMQQKYRMMYSQMKLQNTLYFNQYEIMERKSREKDRIYHDFRNHLIILQKLASDDDNIQIQNYLKELLKNEEEEVKPRIGHPVLDYLLQVKVSKAWQKNIRIEEEYECRMWQIGEENLADWGVLLGNLWDNAIEGCERVEGSRIISFFMRKKGNAVVIKMENSCLQNVDLKYLKTVKQDSEVHGIGLQNMEYVVARHNGMIKRDCRDGKFFTQVIMMI